MLTKENIKETINNHKEILDKYGVKSISIFGSYVRGEQTEKSDIDLLVDFEKNSYSNFINLIYSL